jgi:RNA polymerase sigma-70 factor (ECF subfamily)
MNLTTEQRGPSSQDTNSPGQRGLPGAAPRGNPPYAALDNQINTLLPAARTGDHDATSEMMRLIDPLIVRYCRNHWRQARWHVSVADIAQDVHVAVIIALPRFADVPNKFLPYVYAIARYKIIDAQRHAKTDRSAPFADPPEAEAQGQEPHKHYEQVELSEYVHRQLRNLNATERAVLVLRILHELTSIETAHILGIKAATVRNIQYRALRRLRARLHDDALAVWTVD